MSAAADETPRLRVERSVPLDQFASDAAGTASIYELTNRELLLGDGHVVLAPARPFIASSVRMTDDLGARRQITWSSRRITTVPASDTKSGRRAGLASPLRRRTPTEMSQGTARRCTPHLVSSRPPIGLLRLAPEEVIAELALP